MGERRTSSQGRCRLSLSGPAVLFPRGALKLLKLTYYLLDWANMFVFCVHVCASGCHAPFSPFFLIDMNAAKNVEHITSANFPFMYGDKCKPCFWFHVVNAYTMCLNSMN